MNTTHATRTISWFGKLPCVGDFCSMNMPARRLAAFDDWLSHALLDGQSRHAERWAQAYFNAPIHGFLLGPNTFHTLPAEQIAGVIMPSVDKAGRAFPFILMEQLPEQPTQQIDLQSLNNWFLKAHGLCAKALNEEWNLDSLTLALASLPTLQLTHTSANTVQTKTGQGQWFRIEFNGQIDKVLECAGLPQGQAFDALLGLQQHELP